MLNGPAPEDRSQVPGNRELNLSMIPDFVPENLLELKTPSQVFKERFDAFSKDNQGREITSADKEALEIAGVLLTQLAACFDEYLKLPGVSKDDLIFDVQATRTAPDGSVFLLVDITDHFFTPVPGLRSPDTAPASSLYEKFAAPVRHFAGVVPSPSALRGGASGLQMAVFAPLFNDNSYLELLKHLEDAGGYLSRAGRSPTNGRNLPVASFLFDRALASMEESLRKDEEREGGGVLYSISDIKGIKVMDDHSFDVSVLIQRYSRSDKGIYSGHLEEQVFHFTSGINEYGFLNLSWKKGKRADEDSGMPPGKMAA